MNRWTQVLAGSVCCAASLMAFAGAQTATQTGNGAGPLRQGSTQEAEAASARLTFEIASVKQNTSGMPPVGVPMTYNVPLTAGAEYSPTGGLLDAKNVPLFVYILFAYKMTPDQVQSFLSGAPKWLIANRYDIEAKAQGSPGKDDLRAMMQNLLDERFHLKMHKETQEGRVYALTVEKPGRLGPDLQAHPADGPPCVPQGVQAYSSTMPPFPRTVAGGFPEVCGGIVGGTSLRRAGAFPCRGSKHPDLGHGYIFRSGGPPGSSCDRQDRLRWEL
jgi:hypothetical protein